MANVKIPNPLERRHLIEREQTAEQALALAEAYVEEGRTEEATVFFRKAGAEDRLEALLADAIAAGDVFLIQSISRDLGKDLPTSTWQQVAQNARAAGKEVYAEAADRQAQRGND